MENIHQRYDELCRLCASYDAVKMDIFGQEGKNRQLVDKIQTCLPFKIIEGDRLPKCLCYRCMYNLENFYDFRTACINAVALLERCLPIEDVTKKEVEDTTEYSELRMELLKEKEHMPNLIPEAPVINPNAALGTPPRLKSESEPDNAIEEIIENNEIEEPDEYEMDMETNPSDFLEMTSLVPGEDELLKAKDNGLFKHHNEQHEVYVCSLCNKAFSSKGHLSLHARIHVGAGDVIGEKVITDDHTSYKRPYQCDLCNKSYSTAKHRWGHVSTTHRGHPAVTCAYCSRIYSTRTNLDEHVKSRHAGMIPLQESTYVQQDKRFQCKTCPKMYTNITELNKHSKNCLGDQRKELANNLNNTGKIKGNLENISDISSIDSDYDIHKDYKSAEAKLAKNPQLTILKQALIKGDAKKEYEERQKILCKSKKLSNTDDLDLKRWYCEVCPLNFATQEELNYHEKTHDAEKPYICILCEKDFALKSSLSRHILSSHGVDPSPIIESEKCLKKSVQNVQSLPMSMKQENLGTKENSPLPSDKLENDLENEQDNGQTPVELETFFVCEICTRDFNDRASLWLHIRATHKEYAAFACGICLKICQDNEQLLNHVNMYHGGSKLAMSEQRRYSCTICGRQHDSRKKLITHVSIHNIDPAYDPASFVQLNTNYYNENMSNNEGNELIMDCDPEENEKIDCYVCNKSFPNEDQLIRHQRNAHKTEQLNASTEFGNVNQNDPNINGNRAQYHLFFVCELCGSSHPSKWERWLHVSSMHSDEISIKCEKDECAKIFATKSLRNEHVQHHLLQGISPNTCEICGKLWGSRVDYWKHVMGVHSDTVPLICGVCLKVFPDVLQLNSHVKLKHWPLTNGDFSCDICGRPYSNKSKMSRHRKIHGLDGERYVNPNNSIMQESQINDIPSHIRLNSEPLPTPIVTNLSCEMCAGMKFAALEDLSNHRRMVHSLFPCDLCNKCYGRTSHLWKHVNRVHKGHADVTCRFCLKTSASKDHLAAHIAKIHRYEPEVKNLAPVKDLPFEPAMQEEGDVLHFCEKCNKSFHKRYLLRRHMKGCQNYRKDPGALLTRCRACERIFKDRASLQKHLENHHSSYECHLCKETITSKLGIMTHNRIHHMNHPDLTCEVENCKKLFRTKEDLESHRKDHQFLGTPNVCDFCGDTVENKLKLKMHILSLHRNEIGVSCGVCLIPMKDPKDLKKHVEDVHESILLKPNTCQVCGKKYASKWKAFDHTKKCHGKVFRTCKQCLAVFTTDNDLRYHYEHIHNIPKDQLDVFQYRLDVGPKVEETFEEHDSLEVVVKEEPEELDFEAETFENNCNDPKRKRPNNTYDCQMCPEIFLNQNTLSQHYRNVHSTDPTRMFKKMKQDNAKPKKKMRERENFECKNCQKQFCTKTLYWSHINACNRRNASTSILEAHLKNNNQSRKDDSDEVLTETNLNIPDFNLFEDINMQLSGQKPVPSLMPLPSKSQGKYSRKDSRKVYDESTNTECTCEVCGKPWPAKKHLWQHLIRFHRAEAAVTCGVCLKLCTDYTNLSNHLKSTHPSILSTAGNNFTCKICGRYHNARSKLYLHMSIHINCDTNFMCQKCNRTFENEEKLKEHVAICLSSRGPDLEQNVSTNEKVKVEEIATDDKGSLIGDEDEPEEEGGEAEYESEDGSENVDSSSDKSNDSDSDSTSSSDDDDDDDDSKNSDDASDSDSKDSDNSEEMEDSQNTKEKMLSIGQEEEEIDEYGLQEKKSVLMNYNSDEEGPPLLSPMMPSIIKQENMNGRENIRHQLNSLTKNSSLRETEEVDDKTEDSDSSSEDGVEESEEEDDDENQDQIVDENSGYQDEDNSQSMNEEVIQDDCIEEVHNVDNVLNEEVLEMDANELHNLNGTVLMLTNDADGNQILIERNMADLGSDVQDMTEYVFQDGNGFELEDYESIVQGQHVEEQDYADIKDLDAHHQNGNMIEMVEQVIERNEIIDHEEISAKS